MLVWGLYVWSCAGCVWGLGFVVLLWGLVFIYSLFIVLCVGWYLGLGPVYLGFGVYFLSVVGVSCAALCCGVWLGGLFLIWGGLAVWV